MADRALVAVDALSWRPHPLPRGTDVTDILPADVLEACVARGEVVLEESKPAKKQAKADEPTGDSASDSSDQ